jgi:hypothetical protein
MMQSNKGAGEESELAGTAALRTCLGLDSSSRAGQPPRAGAGGRVPGQSMNICQACRKRPIDGQRQGTQASLARKGEGGREGEACEPWAGPLVVSCGVVIGLLQYYAPSTPKRLHRINTPSASTLETLVP